MTRERRGGKNPTYTAAQNEMIAKCLDEDLQTLAERLGRTRKAIQQRRHRIHRERGTTSPSKIQVVVSSEPPLAPKEIDLKDLGPIVGIYSYRQRSPARPNLARPDFFVEDINPRARRA